MTRSKPNIYGGKDPRELPAYTVAEAARYLKLAPATLRSWILGRPYAKQDGRSAFSEPVINCPDPPKNRLSFWNLIEAHVLRSLRVDYFVSMKHVRIALSYAEKKFGIKRLLLSKELCTEAGSLFLKKYGELINLSKSGQLAMKEMLEDYLERVDWDVEKFPIRLFPFHREVPTAQKGLKQDASKMIVIDPRISFGRPVIERKGISTATIASRIDAGESVQELAKDYGLETWEIKGAVLYEKAA